MSVPRKVLMSLCMILIAVGLMAALMGAWEGLIVAGAAAIAFITLDKVKPGRSLPHKRYH